MPSDCKPVTFAVYRDGRAFLLLNATPALAERTVAGFMRAAPGHEWRYERA
jgi:hypothetical protein